MIEKNSYKTFESDDYKKVLEKLREALSTPFGSRGMGYAVIEWDEESVIIKFRLDDDDD